MGMSNRRLTVLIAAGLAASLATASCGRQPRRGAADAGKIPVFVGIPPIAYFAERVGGEHLDARVLVAPGQSPHTFEPTPRQVAELNSAKVYFSMGMLFEERILAKVTAANPDLAVVDCRRGIELRTIEEGEAHEGAHEGEGEEREKAGQLDPHVWLDPRLAKVIASNIRDGLKAVDTAHGCDYDANLAEVQKDLDDLDADLRRQLAPLKGQVFMVFHPAFGYFARAYGLRQLAVETGGKEPGARQLAALIAEARQRGIRVVFVQPQFSKKSADTVAKAIGGAVVPIDPLARDYIANLREVGAKIAASFGGEDGQ